MAEPRIVRGLHAVLIAAALVAASGLVHAALLAQTPPPNEWTWELPPIDGYRREALPGQPAATGRHHAHGPVHHFRFEAETGGSALTLTLAAVHSRHHSDFHLDALLDALALARPPAAETRTLQLGSSPAASARVVKGEAERALQTCVVPGAGAGVTDDELVARVEQQRVRGWRQSLRQALGLQRNVQWECVLVAIAGPAGPGAEAELTRLGRLVVEGLQSAK